MRITMSQHPPGQDRLESAAEAAGSAAASLAHKPRSLAALLTVAAPGMGHVQLADDAKRTTAFVLLGATVAATVLSCFVSWPLGLLVYLGALAAALLDLKPELAPLWQSRASGGAASMFGDLGRALSWRLVVAAGALLALSLLLPWYRISLFGTSATASGFDALKLMDLILLAIGAGSAIGGLLNLQPGAAQRPAAARLATVLAGAGAVALGLVVFRLLFVPELGLEPGIERSFGILLAFASSVLLAGGAAGAAAAED